MERIMAVTQHHDAVTGTAKQHVNDDYIKKLYEGAREVSPGAREARGREHVATASILTGSTVFVFTRACMVSRLTYQVCHDAVTGMAKQHMNDDYTKKLYKGALEVSPEAREGRGEVRMWTWSVCKETIQGSCERAL